MIPRPEFHSITSSRLQLATLYVQLGHAEDALSVLESDPNPLREEEEEEEEEPASVDADLDEQQSGGGGGGGGGGDKVKAPLKDVINPQVTHQSRVVWSLWTNTDHTCL